VLKIVVLGSSAGGGSPQWNCNCPVCRQVRAGAPGTRPRTQSSITVSADGENWFLFNASPDLGHQILSNSALHPAKGERHSPIVGAVVTNGDVDHVTGLLTVRESHPLAVYGTSRVQSVLADNSIFNVLNPDFVERRALKMDEPTELKTKDGKSAGIVIEPFTVPGKIALWLEDESAGENFGSQPEDTIGLKISAKEGGEYFFYIPGCASFPPELAERLTDAPMVFFDGTLWQDDEMKTSHVGVKTGNRMGHMSNSGPEGTVAAFAPINVKRKVFIHINNTNPILIDNTPERAEVEAAGWEVSYDGMEIAL